MKKKRKETLRGEVLAIPLSGDRWVYAVYYRHAYWLYKIASKGIIRKTDIFEGKNWLLPFDFSPYFWTVDCKTIHVLAYDPKDDPHVFYDFGADGNPSRRFRYFHGDHDRHISEEETAQFFKIFPIYDMPSLRKYLETLVPQMTWIEGERAVPGAQPEEAEPEPETVDFEINELPVYSVEQLSEVLPEKFEAEELDFECIGDSESGGNVAVRGNVDHAKKALSIIRSQLKIYVPDELLPDIEIEQLGPGDGERKVFGIKGPARIP